MMTGAVMTFMLATMSAEDRTQVEAAVHAYTTAVDAADVAAIENASSDDLRVSFVVGAAPPATMTRGQLLEMIKAGKVGGKGRTSRILSVNGNRAYAVVHGQLERSDASFDVVWQLVKTPKGWRVQTDATLMTPRAP